MSWFNEFECFFLIPLIMKWAFLWAAAACVATADIPCEEYCACILTGIHNVAYQPSCNCLNNVNKFREQLEGSSIYYEPAEYISMPTLIYEQPFYIINPYAAIQRKNIDEINVVRNAQPYQTNQAPSTQIEINIDNKPYLRRKEKDIHNNDNKHTSLYLDIDVEPENAERSASNNVITIDDLKITEEDLIDCANLYTVLDYRKSRLSKLLNIRSLGPFAKYEYLSDDDLINKIDDKCSHVSSIVEKSLNEIKQTRPKKTTFRMHNDKREPNDLKPNYDHLKPNGTDISDIAQEQLINSSSEENSNVFDGDTQDNEQTVVIYADSASNENTTDENTTEIHHIILPITASNTVTLSSNEDASSTTIFSSTKIPFNKDADILMSTTDNYRYTYPTVLPTYTRSSNTDDNTVNTKTTSLQTTPTAETFLTNTTEKINNIDQDAAQNQQSNRIFSNMATDFDSHKERKEGDEALLQIITHEFNNSVLSYTNGSEGPPNREFEDVTTSDAMIFPETSNNVTAELTTERVGDGLKVKSSDILGHLYFLYKQHQIPAKFVQKPTGSLHLGIDGETLCDKLTQDDKHKSVLIKTLCECYKSDNCKNIK